MGVVNGTTLASDLDYNGLDLFVVANAGAAKDRICKIEDEFSVVTKVSGQMVSVRTRGDFGSAVRTHKLGAPVVFMDREDFPAPAPARSRAQEGPKVGLVSYGASGPIAIPEKDTNIDLVGAVALAMTLADPPRTVDGLRLKIQATGAAAHTVTSAGGFNAGAGASDVGTFAAAIGNGLTIEARQGKWLVVGNIGVTLA